MIYKKIISGSPFIQKKYFIFLLKFVTFGDVMRIGGMEIFGYTIIKTDELIRVYMEKSSAEVELKLRPTRDQMFKYGEDAANGVIRPYKEEIWELREMIRGYHRKIAELNEKLAEAPFRSSPR